MDTLFYAVNRERFLNSLITGSIMGVLVLSQSLFVNPPLFADDIKLAQMSSPASLIDTIEIKDKILNEFSMETRAKNFDENIERKYPKAIITDVDTGIKHIKLTKYYDGMPVRINVVEVDLKLADGFELKPALSSTVNNLKSRRTISTIAKNTNSIVAINGTYFKPQTGVPLGTLMIDGKMFTGPVYDRVAMGIFDNGFDMARVQFNSFLKASKSFVKLDNINQPRMLSTHVIAYSNDWGKTSPASPKYGFQIAIKDNKIVGASYSSLAIPDGGYVIVGPAKILRPLAYEKRVKLEISTTPDWKNVKHIISGGPYLVKNSEVFVDMTAQKLGAVGGKNPRTAIGYTKDNNMIMVTVDGREGSSVGMTLMQLAGFMKSLECVNAMNLDGGGSTVMYVNGKIVNKPQVHGGISLSNALVLSKKIN
ncbi:MAG: phosphodiester glycosidase family protein [Brachyspira sp.]|nr:phosphodiester glycosidase family protein [Brachyspira sp.]